MDSTAFMYSENYRLPDGSKPDTTCDTDKVSIWWHDQNLGVKCIFGDVIKRYDTAYVKKQPSAKNKSVRHILIQGGNYAVFSFKRPENGDKVDLYSRILSRYIFREWVLMNHKVTDKMGYTYQYFAKDRIYFCLPLVSGMGIDDAIRPKDWSLSAWADYIDQNITSDLWD